MKKLTFGEAPAGCVLRPRRAAYAVLFDDQGRIAVVQGVTSHSNGYWLPGGGCESGESPEEAIEREVMEELGRRIKNVERLGEAVQVFYAEADQCWFSMDTLFVHGELEDGWGTGAEHEVEWLDPERACAGFYHASHVWAVQRCTQLEDGGEP